MDIWVIFRGWVRRGGLDGRVVTELVDLTNQKDEHGGHTDRICGQEPLLRVHSCVGIGFISFSLEEAA